MFLKDLLSKLFKFQKESAIIIYHGGLGNQLFQYLLGQELTKVYKKKVFYHDIRDSYKTRHNSNIEALFDLNLAKYEIGKFNIFMKFFLSPNFLKIYQYFVKYFNFNLFSNFYLDVNNKPINLKKIKSKDNLIIFFGTWHNLINQYKFSSNPNYLKFSKKIYLPKSFNFKNKFISLHVRRADYLNHKSSRFHGNLDFSYYSKGINYLRNNYGNLPVLLFSDDPDWVKNNLLSLIPNSYVISSNKLSPEIDFYLMTKGSYFILSNSTFSWLSAFLSIKKDKFIILPKYWFAGKNINKNYILNTWDYKII